MPHSITDGDACLAYFNKIWGMPLVTIPIKYEDPDGR
jgi:hypothetical protein